MDDGLRTTSNESRPMGSATATPTFIAVALPIPARSDTNIDTTRHGVVLRVREDLDGTHLARFVAAFAGTSPC